MTQVVVRVETTGETKTLAVAEIAKAASGGRDEATLPLRDDAATSGDGVADMTSLNNLHEAAILYNLRTRFASAYPYTYTAAICIAINPYQWLDLYSDEKKKVVCDRSLQRAMQGPCCTQEHETR